VSEFTSAGAGSPAGSGEARRQRQGRPGEPAVLLWRGAVWPVLGVGVVATALALFRSGPAIAAALFATVLAIGLFSVVPVLMRISRTMPPTAVMGLALAAYGTIVGVLMVVVFGLGDLQWLDAVFASWTLAAATVASLAGQVVAVRNMRVPVFDPPSDTTRSP